MSDPVQRLLTGSEMADFLVRHPLEADYIAKTKIAIETGTYDWSQTLPSWFTGKMIPPWGAQVDDSTYGLVTIFFGADGTLYLSGWSQAEADINKDPYVPPPVTCKDGSNPTFGICPEDFSFVYVIGFSVAAYFLYQAFGKKK